MSIFTDPSEQNRQVDEAMVNGIKSQFPIEGKKYTLSLSDVHVINKDFTHKDEKKAILTSASLTYPIKGDLVLRDKATGKIIDTVKNFTLADTFYITPKHTLVYGGNNYSTANLLVRLPGVFVRYKNDGQIEAEFNTGSGRNFSIILDPQTKIFYVEVESSTIPVAAVLKDVFNLSDQTVERYIPAEIWDANKDIVAGKAERYINSLYSRFVSRIKQNKNASVDEKRAELSQSLLRGQLSPLTTKITLGESQDHLEPTTFLLAMKNIIQVYRGDKEEDNRDSLQFKRVQNLPDFINLRFEKGNETVVKARSTIQFNMDRVPANTVPTVRGVITAKPFNKVFSDFIIKSTLSNVNTEVNPLESIESVGKLTLIAPNEGGAKTERDIPMSARNIDPSQLGIIDPSRTPESSMAGIDQRFTIAAKRDKEGILYTAVKNLSGKVIYISVQEMMDSSIGFPGQDDAKPTDLVHAQVKGKIMEIQKNKVDYWIADPSHLYTITTNLVPFMNSSHPGRMTMAGRALTSALSLVDREEPLVQTVDDQGVPFVTRLGNVISTTSPCNGTIIKVSPEHIEIKDEEGDIHPIDFVRNLPFNMKGFLDDHPTTFKVGDKVVKGQVLADNNYTKNGVMALGKNLYASYLPYKGYNHEDGIVISRNCANKLSSNHAYKYSYALKADTITNKALFRRYFPQALSIEQLNLLDERGIIKPGTRLVYGDPIYSFLEKRVATELDRAFGRLDKLLTSPYNKVLERWEHEEPGVVVDVHSETSDIKIIVRSVKPLGMGDKLTGSHGNKGIVSLILEDHEMPHSKELGGPVDMLLNPASVTSRINLGQMMETAAGKIAQKTGKPYLIKNYSKGNNIKAIQDELKANKLSDTDELIDPKTNKSFGQIFSGPQYFYKLVKTTDANYSARNVGGYDAYLQPSKGGEEGAKGVGYMEMLGLLGSDARKNMKEIATVKSEKSEDFWDKFMLGQPLPKLKTSFATQKFFDYLRAAGVNVREDQGDLVAAPITDSEILKQSNGRILNPGVISAKNGEAEKGGIFDNVITGGLRGTKWSHYKLSEPVVSPVFEKPVKTLLGLKKNEFEGIVDGVLGVKELDPGVFSIRTHDGIEVNRIAVKPGANTGLKKKADFEEDEELPTGGPAIKQMLNSLSPREDLKTLVDQYKKSKSSTIKNALVKKIKYMHGLVTNKITNPGDIYTLKNIPILPPNMHPVIDKGSNRMGYSDVTKLYKEMILSDTEFAKIKDDLPNSDLVNQRRERYATIKAVTGMGEAVGPQSKKQGIKGIMTQITGDEGPKGGMFHHRLLSRQQDMSGRGTIYAAPDVGFNEAKFPKEMLWVMFKMHMIRDMVKNGLTLMEAKNAYDKRSLVAENSFKRLIKEVPIWLNRPPTLMKTNMMAVYGVPNNFKTIGLNILHLPGYAADFDGDALMVHLPVTPEAIAEAREKALPQRHLSDARKGFSSPMFAPGHEAILGSVHLSKPDMDKGVIKFDTEEEALNALRSGDIEDNQPIQIGE